MDLKHLEYVVAVAEEKNITRAADKLYITQPTLSHYLLKIEKDLGVSLFNRTKNLMIPTYAGEIYVNSAKELLQIIRNTESMIEDIVSLKKGRLTLGISPERGYCVLPSVFPQFQKEYPGINIELVQHNARRLEMLTLQGYIDLSVFSIYNHKTELSYEVLCNEEVVLAVPKSHRLAHLADNAPKGKRQIVDISLFKDEPFVLMKPGNSVRHISDTIFKDAGIAPKILLECENVHAIQRIASTSSALSFVPETISKNIDVKDTLFFSINPEKYCWDLVVAYRNGAYLNNATRDLISMLRTFFTS